MIDFRDVSDKDFNIVFSYIQKLWDYNQYDPVQTEKVYCETLAEPGAKMFLIEDDAGIHGWCHINIFRTFWLSGPTCYLSAIIVNEADRGKGYGKKMLDHVVEVAKREGCTGIILESALQRQKTHRFYEKYGFEKSCYGFELKI